MRKFVQDPIVWPLAIIRAFFDAMERSLTSIRVGIVYLDQFTDAARIICKQLSLNCTFVQFDGFDYGTVLDNGTTTGMVGALHRGEFDTFQPTFTPTYQRLKAIDFSDPYFYEVFVLATRAPSKTHESITLKAVMALKWQTWCVFLASLVLTSTFLVTTSRKVFKAIDHTNPHWVGEITQFWTSLITHDHHDRHLQFHFARQVIAAFSLTLVVLTSAYTSVLFSDRLRNPIALPYKDLETFVTCLEEARCRIITHTLSSSSISLMVGPENEYGKRIQATFAKRPMIYNPNIDVVPRIILEEKTVYYAWFLRKTAFEAVVQNNYDCRFYIMPVDYTQIESFPMRKKSPLKSMLNFGAAAFVERGLSEATTALRYKNAGTFCSFTENIDQTKIFGSSTVIVAFCLLGFGIFVTCVLFLAEVIIRWLGYVLTCSR